MLYEENLTRQIIGAAIEVHRYLGPGLLESVYEECLCRELELRNLAFERQKSLPLEYKGMSLNCGYRVDIMVGNSVILELKCVESIAPVHEAQLLTYLRLSGRKVGLILNFYATVMKDVIKRLVL